MLILFYKIYSVTEEHTTKCTETKLATFIWCLSIFSCVCKNWENIHVPSNSVFASTKHKRERRKKVPKEAVTSFANKNSTGKASESIKSDRADSQFAKVPPPQRRRVI